MFSYSICDSSDLWESPLSTKYGGRKLVGPCILPAQIATLGCKQASIGSKIARSNIYPLRLKPAAVFWHKRASRGLAFVGEAMERLFTALLRR